MTSHFSRVRRQAGVAMVEAMVAVVILGIGVIGAVGMQARAAAALNDAGMRAEATMAADKLFGTITADAANVGSYALAEDAQPNAALAPWVTETRTFIPNARISVAVTPQVRRSRVDISIGWTTKSGGTQNTHRVSAYIGS